MSVPSFDDRDGSIWFDGELIDFRSAKIHVLSHGLHYGSAVFEGERVYNGKIFKSSEHTERIDGAGAAITMSAFPANEFVSPGAAKVKMALFPAPSWIVPLFKPRALVAV